MNINPTGVIVLDPNRKRKVELASRISTVFVNTCQHAPYPEGRTCAGHAPYGKEPVITRTNGTTLKASQMTDDKLRYIDEHLNGSVIRDLDSGEFLDPESVSHEVYRLHQIDLGNLLNKSNPNNLYKIIKNRDPLEIVKPGETGPLSNLGNAPNQPGKRPRSNYRVYDTAEELGVNLAVILDESNGRVVTIIPTTPELEVKKEAQLRIDRRTRKPGGAANLGRTTSREVILSKKSEDDQTTEILTTDQIREKRNA